MAAWNCVLYTAAIFLAAGNVVPSSEGNVLKVPKECKEGGFCTITADSYKELQGKIDKVLPEFLKKVCGIREDVYHALVECVRIGIERTGLETEAGIRLRDEFAQRSKDDSDGIEKLSPKSDWHNCPVKTKKAKPHLYTHVNNLVDIIVQTEQFSQVIESVRCALENISASDTANNQECFQHLRLDLARVKTSCETVYTQRKLYVYNETLNKVHQKQYPVAVCCVCKLTETF